MSVSYIYCPLTSCQVSAKSNVGKYQISGDTHTHGRTFPGSSSAKAENCNVPQGTNLNFSASSLQTFKLPNLVNFLDIGSIKISAENFTSSLDWVHSSLPLSLRHLELRSVGHLEDLKTVLVSRDHQRPTMVYPFLEVEGWEI